jgi:hypothetical protein
MKYKIGDVLKRIPSPINHHTTGNVMITEVSSNSYEIVFLQEGKPYWWYPKEDIVGPSRYTYICSINDLDLK